MSIENFGLIVVSAPSGTGKSTLCNHLLKDLPERLKLSISTTSRKPRGTEKDGVEYLFTDAVGFEQKITEGAFVEWANVHGNYYGTMKSTLENFWKQQRHVLLDIDVQGAANLKKQYPDKTLLVFLEPPSMEALEARLRSRGTDTDESIQKRMANSREEMKRRNEFDAVLVNDVFESAYLQLRETVLKFMDRLEAKGDDRG